LSAYFQELADLGFDFEASEKLRSEGGVRPLLSYLADTITVSDFFRAGTPVKQWFNEHRGQMGLEHSERGRDAAGNRTAAGGQSETAIGAHLAWKTTEMGFWLSTNRLLSSGDG